MQNTCASFSLFVLYIYAHPHSIFMSSKYKVHDDAIPHFITCTTIGWIDVFSREEYKRMVVDSLSFCQLHKGLDIHAWVIMTNHLHLIVSSQINSIPFIIRDFKKYTSKQIVQSIANNPIESRKEWMLNLFAYAGRNNNNNKDIQFWRQDYHPIALDDDYKYNQRLHYLHENPVRSGLVWEPWHYKYSSAIDYYQGEKGLLPLKIL